MSRYHIEMDSCRCIGWVTLVGWIGGAIAAFCRSERWAGAVLVAGALGSVYLVLDA